MLIETNNVDVKPLVSNKFYLIERSKEVFQMFSFCLKSLAAFSDHSRSCI